MKKHDRHQTFGDELLAQETSVSGEQYEAYRHGLARSLAAEARTTSPSPGRRLRRQSLCALAALTAAAVLLIALLTRHQAHREEPLNVDSRRESVGEQASLVVLRLPSPERKPPAPFERETTADLIATATLGKPFAHGQDQVYPLHFQRILKGQPPQGTVATSPQRKLPTFCCEFPTPPTSLSKDDKVLIYLCRTPRNDWTLIDLRPVDEEFVKKQLPQIERGAKIADAARSPNSKAIYQQLLLPPAGRLDFAACGVLSCKPDPRASDALLEHLRRLRQEIAHTEIRPTPELPEGTLSDFDRLTGLLAQIHETRAILPVLECVRRIPRGQRGGTYARLPDLCKSADPATLERVNDVLSREIQDASGHARDRVQAATALVKISIVKFWSLSIGH